MKKSMLLTGALMLMMASCSNEEILPNEEVKNNAEPTLTIIATQGEDADSRLAFVDEKNLQWTPGDIIIVTESGVPANCVALTLQETEPTATGTFSTNTTLPEAWNENTELMAYYFNRAIVNLGDNGLMIGQLYDDPNNMMQIQTANNNNEHLLDFNHMKSATPFTYAGGPKKLKFSHQGAIMKFVLSGLGGETVKSLKLECEKTNPIPIPFFALLNIIGQEIITPEAILDFCSFSTTLYLGESGNGITLGTDETLTAYLMVSSTEWLENILASIGMPTFPPYSFKLTAITDGDQYVAQVSGGKLEAGKIYTLNKTMEKPSIGLEGEGNSTSPYQIATMSDLMKLHTWIVQGYSTEGLHFKLMNNLSNINFTYYDIYSIGGTTADNGFKGTFDGGGYTIDNLVITTVNYDNLALFGCIAAGGTVKNLHLTNANLYGKTYVGGIASINYGTIEGCTVSGEITARNIKVGGITGVNYGRIEGCSVTGKIEAGLGFAGGIAGENYGTIVACGNGTTIGKTYLSANVGGIAGYADGTNCTIIGCYNTGSISGTEHIGGILGYAANNITMTSCYNTGTVSSDDETSVGNMIGTNEGTATFQDCCWATGAGVGSGSENASWNGGGGSGYNNEGYANWVEKGMVVNMNSSLNNSGINWRYVANEDEATKEQEPYKLQKVNL
ncbi:MAG: hypothetical protein IJ494_02175 [Bacteroides sp.]|nr:hypothetical protein [Bacteroides sp.]